MEIGTLVLVSVVVVFLLGLGLWANRNHKWVYIATDVLVISVFLIALLFMVFCVATLATTGPPDEGMKMKINCPSAPVDKQQEAQCAEIRAELTAAASYPEWWPWKPHGPYFVVIDDAFFATQTAVASPGGAEYNAIAVTLQDLAAHPESYKGKWVEMHDAPVLHVYCSSELTVGTASQSVYVDYAVPVPAPSFQEGDNIDLVIGQVGGDCKGHYPAKALLCGQISGGPGVLRPGAPWWKSFFP